MRKDIIVTALLTFSLASTIFMIATSRSADYDPWIDINDDGKIDIFDVVGMTSRYAATGNPTKNVTIAGHAGKLAYSTATNVAPYSYLYSPWISVNGYSKITICIHNIAVDNRYTLATSHSGGWGFYADTQVDFGEDLVKTYDVPNEQVQVQFSNQGSYDTSLYIDVYLIP